MAQNMRDFMEAIGLGDRFATPEEWLDKVLDTDRPHRKASPKAQEHPEKSLP